MSLLHYLSQRLMILAVFVSLGIFYIVYILYHWGLDDSTEYYLAQDMLWAKDMLENQRVLPDNNQFKQFYLVSEQTAESTKALSNSAIPVNELPREYLQFLSNNKDSEYFFLEIDNNYHYGLVHRLDVDSVLILIHQFLVDDTAEGMSLFEISMLASLLVIILMLLCAYLIYHRISLSMQNLLQAARLGSEDQSERKGKVEREDYQEVKNEFSEINTIIESLINVLQTLESKNQEEYLFIHTLSHELRTPMATVQVALELLSKKEISDEVRDKLEVIFNSNRQMQSLSKDLLLLWSNKENDTEYDCEYSSACSLISNVENEIRQVISDLDKAYPSHQRFTLKVNSQTIHTINPIPSNAYLRILLNNLLKNAIVHSDSAIEIRLDINGFAIINEITHADSQRQQLDPLVAGTGIGLIIAKRAAEKMGWKLHIQQSHIEYKVCVQFNS